MVNTVVMKGRIVSAVVYGSSCPGLTRASRLLSLRVVRKDVDGRVKPGHDALRERDERSGMTRFRASFLGLAGILYRLEGGEFRIVELTVDLLDLADIDVLHDVARLRVDREWAAGAFPLPARHGRRQRIALRLAASLLHRLVDQVDAVIAADRHGSGTLREGLLVGGDEVLVHRGRMGRGIHVRRRGAEC